MPETCFFCGAECGDMDLCFGCGEYICEACDHDDELSASHPVEDHHQDADRV